MNSLVSYFTHGWVLIFGIILFIIGLTGFAGFFKYCYDYAVIGDFKEEIDKASGEGSTEIIKKVIMYKIFFSSIFLLIFPTMIGYILTLL